MCCFNREKGYSSRKMLISGVLSFDRGLEHCSKAKHDGSGGREKLQVRKQKCTMKKGDSIVSNEGITNTSSVLLTTPGKSHQVLLTTFRRNGEGVNTQVGTISANGKIYFMTPADTWKVKRMTNNPHVTLAPCTGRGKASGPALAGTARRIYGDEMQRARELLRTGVLGHFWSFVFTRRNPGDKTAVYEVELLPEKAESGIDNAALIEN